MLVMFLVVSMTLLLNNKRKLSFECIVHASNLSVYCGRIPPSTSDHAIVYAVHDFGIGLVPRYSKCYSDLIFFGSSQSQADLVESVAIINMQPNNDKYVISLCLQVLHYLVVCLCWHELVLKPDHIAGKLCMYVRTWHCV